jgi:hypothetical protein
MAPLAACLVIGVVAGCGSSPPSSGGAPARKITWAEYQQMDAEQQDDPYVLDNLDDAARKKLAAQQRKRKR